MSDMKVRLRVASDDAFYYPDLMLACDPEDRATYYRTRPCLIVEVLSDTTQRIDRREKLLAYTSIDSLQEYLLLSQNGVEATLHRRVDGWRGQTATTGDVRLPVKSLHSDANGVVHVSVDKPGRWYVKFIRMVPLANDTVDYESKWATITFEIR